MGEDASWSLELVDSWAGSHDALERGDSWEESWPFTLAGKVLAYAQYVASLIV